MNSILKDLKLIAWAILLVPIVGFAFVGLFQWISSGETSTILNSILILPLAAIALVARRKPQVAGLILITVSLLLAVLYPLGIRGLNTVDILSLELLLFLPPLVAGVIFLSTSKN